MSGRPRRVRAALSAVLAVVMLGCAFALLSRTSAQAKTYDDTADQPAELVDAISYVTDRGYMGGAGGRFRPADPVTRLEYATAVVKLFEKQKEPLDLGISFKDLESGDPGFEYANIAVKLRFIGVLPDGSFGPRKTHPTVSCLAGLNTGLGLDGTGSPVESAQGLWPDGPPYAGHSIVSSDLHLKYRYTGTEPSDPYPRSELAYSLRAAEQVEEWRLDYVRESFNRLSCQRPVTGPMRTRALGCAFAKLGYPYVWGGESDAEGGYDCSGLTYYVLRTVLGMPMQRTADDQAKDGRYPMVPRNALLPGDPIFFYRDPVSSDYIGHAGMYVGLGMFIHSTGSNAGVSVDHLSGYWNDNFAWGKRVIPEGDPESFDTYILLCNPSGSSATARLTYMLRDGRQVAEQRKLKAYSRSTVRVDDTLLNEEFSTKVEALEGTVVAERSMYFKYLGRFSGGHSSPGAPAPARDWFLAEGCTAYDFDTYVLIQNPGEEACDVAVTFMKSGGKTVRKRIEVGPFSRYTVAVDGVPGMEEAEFSTRVTSDREVVVERSMYFDYRGVKEGHNSVGLTGLSRSWYFAEGYTEDAFDTYVLLANPADTPASVVMTLMSDDGEVSDIEFGISPHARRTVAVDRIKGWTDRAFSVKIRSNLPVAAERAVYFKYRGRGGGHCATGTPEPGLEWFLAEGYTADEFDTFILVSNPSQTAARIRVRFMLDGGRFSDRTYRVPARSRYTIEVDKQPGLTAEEVSALVTSSVPVVVERSMYFEYLGKQGGSCSPAVSGPGRLWYFAEGYTGR